MGNNHKRPLSELDTETQTLGCRAFNPDVCKNHSTLDKCAFVRDDNICMMPPHSWKKHFKELKKVIASSKRLLVDNCYIEN